MLISIQRHLLGKITENENWEKRTFIGQESSFDTLTMFTKHPFVLYRVEHTHPLLLGIFQSKGGLKVIKSMCKTKQNKTKQKEKTKARFSLSYAIAC